MIKKNNILFVLFIICELNTFGRQSNRPILDTNGIKNWPTISLSYDKAIITNDGLFAGYGIKYKNPDGNKSISSVDYIFHKINGSWEIKIEECVGVPLFTEDSRLGIIKTENKDLYLVELGGLDKKVFHDVSSYKLFKFKNKEYLSIYRENLNSLQVINIKDNSEEYIGDVLEYCVSEENASITLVTKLPGNKYEIRIKNYQTNSISKIWSSDNKISDLTVSNNGENLSFYNKESIWVFKNSSLSQPKKVDLGLLDSSVNFTYNRPEYFSSNGNLLIFSINNTNKIEKKDYPGLVQIFSYQDFVFNINGYNDKKTFLCTYDFNTQKSTRIENNYENVLAVSADKNVIVLSHLEGDNTESHWNKKGWNIGSLLYLENHSRIVIDSQMTFFTINNNSNYIVYANNRTGDLYCLNINTKDTFNITRKIPIPLVDNYQEHPISNHSRAIEFYSSSSTGDSIIFYDRYDIWIADLKAKTPPVNLTKGIGRKNKISFRFLEQFNNLDKSVWPGFNDVYISGFNENTKENGFFKINIYRDTEPLQLTMGSYVYCAPGQHVDFAAPKRAKNANVWLVVRMSASESPNYFWTSDFRHFHNVSNIYPERNFQWFTTELITFSTKDGTKTNAILFKPNNFDRNKKYPVLFNCYEHESAKLNFYFAPEFNDGYSFNIPMMLSRGYLVCLTDVHFRIGETAYSIVDALEGAGKYLAERPYIDNRYFGFCGGSFGGYAANCIATFSDMFAASVSISGISDLIGMYGNIPGLKDELVENRQLRMGVSLGSDPDRYFINSPLIYSKYVKTPILIVNSLKDYNVNVQQGLEWFNSLRRESKPVWMLIYQQEGHGVRGKSCRRDLFIRMNQFFDYYLQMKPAPLWMTENNLTNTMSKDVGFELNSNSR